MRSPKRWTPLPKIPARRNSPPPCSGRTRRNDYKCRENLSEPLRPSNGPNRIHRSRCFRATAQTESFGAAASERQPKQNPSEPLPPNNGSNRIHRSRCFRATAQTESIGAAASEQRLKQNPSEPLPPSNGSNRIHRSHCFRATAQTKSIGAAASEQRPGQEQATLHRGYQIHPFRPDDGRPGMCSSTPPRSPTSEPKAPAALRRRGP